MAQAQHATTPKGLWVLLIAGPALVALAHETNFVLVPQACSAQRSVMLYVVVGLAIVLTIVTILIGYSIWKRTGTDWPTETEDLANRIRFITVLGILSSVMSILVLVAQGIATVYFDPCQL